MLRVSLKHVESLRGYVQLSVCVCSLGGVEGDRDEVGSHGVVEHTAPPAAIVTGRLVDNIPSIALTDVVAHDVGNVRLDDGLQLIIREATARYWFASSDFHRALGVCTQLTPAGKLAIPGQSVTPQNLAICRRQVRNSVAAGVREGALRGLGILPFLPVLGHQLTELVDVVGDGHVWCIAQVSVVNGRPEVQQPGVDS